MARIWTEGKRNYKRTVEEGNPDASEMLKAEHSVRRNFSRILLKTSVRYGNKETKRVKREEGKKEYLNTLWDYGGSRIRDIVKARYIFPRPARIELIGRSIVYGYHGSTKTPFYPVRHNHLPELDFGDMIRSPLMELARQCLKYGAPMNEAKKYIDALLLQLIPFLDYVYTERRSGKSNYVRDGLRELRTIVDQVRAEFGTRNGRRRSITAETQELIQVNIPAETDQDEEEAYIANDEEQDEPKPSHILEETIEAARREGVVLEDYLKEAEALLKNNILTIEDSVVFLKQVTEERRRIGVRVHEFVCRNFQSPFSFNGVVYHGKEMVYDDSGLLLLSEVPVDDGRGRIDFVLARVRQLTRVDGADSLIFCEPFMLVELKTKSAFDFDIYGAESRATRENNTVSEFVFDWRALTDKEWEYVLATTLDDYEREQLKAYEKAALRDYQRVMWKDTDAQTNLSRAVIVVDAHQDWRDIQQAILPLVLRAYKGCVDGTLSDGDLLVPSEGDKRLRIAMRLLAVVRPTTDTVSLSPPHPLEFSSQPIDDAREFVLYLTVPGRGSSAQSAAAIAERWHGLEYVYSFAHRQHRDIFWFDLAGEFSDPVLRKKQFRLHHQDSSVRRFLNRRVKMRNLSELIRRCVYEGEPIDTLRTWIRGQLKGSRRPIVVVSGWENMRRSTPTTNQEYLDEIATAIIQTIPRRSSVVWFARPVPLAQNNTTYRMRCVAPFYQGTQWQTYADTVVWNVAMPPDRKGTLVPTNDHWRAIFVEQAGRLVDSKVIEIKPLRGWGEDFRAGGTKRRQVYNRAVGSVSQQDASYNTEGQLEQVLTLIPHLKSNNEYNTAPQSNFALAIEEVSSEYSGTPDYQSMVSFRPTQIYTDSENTSNTEIEVDGRYRILLPMESINRKREYREMELGVSPQRRSTRPPSEALLSVTKIDDQQIVRTEMRHLRNTIKLLRRGRQSHLREILDQLSELVEVRGGEKRTENANLQMNRLRLVRQILETSPLSKSVWEQLLPTRSVIPRGLSLSEGEYIVSLQVKHPDVLLLTGNHLFLLVLAALGSTTEIAFPASLAASWEYVQPWHLMALGFRPSYPSDHTSGRSVLDRRRILKRLRRRIIENNRLLGLQTSPTNIRFGQLIALPSSGATDSSYFWLFFQRAPGIYDMNAGLLNPRGVDPSFSPLEVLQEMVSEKSYWTETDLSLLSWHAKMQGDEVRIPIMIADLHGLQVLWISDKKQRKWIPVAQIDYTTRRFEDVTLIRTITLSREPHLQQMDYSEVRNPIQPVEDMVSTALFILDKGLEGCTLSKCYVSLDTKEQFYRVVFRKQETGETLGHLLVARTADLIEILRRPDDDCEPVIVNGKQLIWSRFRDIIYDDDVAIIRPWVDRNRPFTGLGLQLPPYAFELSKARKDFDFLLELYHDPWTCPLRHISMETIREASNRAHIAGDHYLFRYETHWAEPERVSNEPGVHHGSCWRIQIHTPHRLTPELRKLIDARWTDAQMRSLLSPRELVYWSNGLKEWITHTFRIILRSDCIEEARESWHIRIMLKELTGRRYAADVPGVYLTSPDRWSPYFIVEPEHVTVGLKEKDTGLVREHIVHERGVALRPKDEVEELLKRSMKTFLNRTGIRSNRRLEAGIREEIAAAIEISGTDEERTTAMLDRVEIRHDSVGGRVICVVLQSDNGTHIVPVTRHLHDIKEIGRLSKEDFEREISSILEEFNLKKEEREIALNECIRLLRKENLLR
jgi:hypothetical protein